MVLNLLGNRSDRRRWAGKQSSKRVNDREPHRNSFISFMTSSTEDTKSLRSRFESKLGTYRMASLALVPLTPSIRLRRLVYTERVRESNNGNPGPVPPDHNAQCAARRTAGT